jgi:hypothetical protein
MADEIQTFLEKNNLSQYVNKFMELGYDDLKQLLDMQPEEIIDVLKEVVLYGKSDHQCHRKRFIYLHSAIEILSSKTKHGVQDKDMASQCTTPMSSVSHKYVTTCKYIYINMFKTFHLQYDQNVARKLFAYHIHATCE